MRISIALLTALIANSAVHSRVANAGPIETLPFNFANDGSPAYRYVSGDLPFEATAQLSGGLTLQYDTITGDAWISLVEGTLHSPVQTYGNPFSGIDWLEGADLEVEVPGMRDGLPGVQTSPLEFAFGPGLAPSGVFSYRYDFTLSIADGVARLSGKSEFDGFDGSTMYLNVPLTAIPEPACLLSAAIAGIALLGQRRRSR